MLHSIHKYMNSIIRTFFILFYYCHYTDLCALQMRQMLINQLFPWKTQLLINTICRHPPRYKLIYGFICKHFQVTILRNGNAYTDQPIWYKRKTLSKFLQVPGWVQLRVFERRFDVRENNFLQQLTLVNETCVMIYDT